MLYSKDTFTGISDHNDCHGCGLCTLVCPVWHQKADVRYTPHGHAKSLQCGGEPEAETVMDCILCGACASMCPQNIDLFRLMLNMRQKVVKADAGITESTTNNNISAYISNSDNQQDSISQNTTVLLTAPGLRNDEQIFPRIIDCLNQSGKLLVADDCGDDILESILNGADVPQQRLQSFLDPLRNAANIITDNGLFMYKLKSWLPGKTILSLGQAISNLGEIRNQLNTNDFYVIESSAFNTNTKQLLPYYNELQSHKGCELNLDLHRLAIPTGGQYTTNMTDCSFDAPSQANWLLSGRQFDRIIVEDIDDYKLLSSMTDKPVMHISELLS